MSGEDCRYDLELTLDTMRFWIECGLFSVMENRHGTLTAFRKLYSTYSSAEISTHSYQIYCDTN